MPGEKAHDLREQNRTADVITQNGINFRDMLLSDSTIKGLDACGFKEPSPIQQKAIPLGRCGFDLIVQAKSGTGKTCVFAVIALEMLNRELDKLQALILTPTREIAVQVADVISSIGQKGGKINVKSFIGGLPLESDIKKLKKCQIAVGAPGRVKHLISTNAMNVDSVRLFVLDEADKLMEDSFKNDVSFIYSKLPVSKQIIASSATFPESLEKFVLEYMVNPMKATPGNETILLGIQQFASVIPQHNSVLTQMRNKISELIRILSSVSFKQCLVFSNYQSRAESICNQLNKQGWPAIYISGSQNQQLRLKALSSLKEYRCRVLLSTDLSSRGIDAENVNLIINLDLPYDGPTYLHRIGRAGRYGSHGLAITIIQDGTELEQFQKMLYEIGGENFNVLKFPPGKISFDIWNAKKVDFEKISSQVGEYEFSRVKVTKEEEKSEEATRPQNAETKAITNIDNNRIIISHKNDFVNYDDLSNSFENFKIDDKKIKGKSFDVNDLKLNDTSMDLISSLIFLESSGKRSLNESFEAKVDVKANEKETGLNAQDFLPCLPNRSETSDTNECESEEEYSNESGDEEEDSEFDDENKKMNRFKSCSNWYEMWYRQLLIIRQYSHNVYYWNEMMNFS